VIDCVVAPVDQTLPVADEEVSVIVLFAATDEGPLMVGVATVLAETTLASELAVPRALVTVTVYEPAADTVIDCVVAPVDQRFPDTDDDVSVIVPEQRVDAPLIVGVGAAIPRPPTLQTGASEGNAPWLSSAVLFMNQTTRCPVP
jgi:hypothetical protein